jgi:hypothetical protein
MLVQRGRRSRSSQEFLALVGNLPNNNPPKPPKPSYPLAPLEQRIWDRLTLANDFSYASLILLCNALLCLGRARVCAATVEQQGPMIMTYRGVPRAHPLISIERRLRNFCHQAFKKLKIELRGELFDRT